jgi:hypothetical protein
MTKTLVTYLLAMKNDKSVGDLFFCLKLMQWGDTAETLGYYVDNVRIIDNYNITINIFQHQV